MSMQTRTPVEDSNFVNDSVTLVGDCGKEMLNPVCNACNMGDADDANARTSSLGNRKRPETMSGDLLHEDYSPRASNNDAYDPVLPGDVETSVYRRGVNAASDLFKRRRRLRNSKLRLKNSRLDIVKKMHTEFLQLTSRDQMKDEWILYYYPFLFQGGLVLYALLLGLSTLIDWRHLSFKMVLLMLVLRSVFTSFFIYDLYMQYRQQDKQLHRLVRKPLFIVDVALCVYDLGLISFMVVLLLTKSNLLLRTDSQVAAETEQILILLRNLSAIPIFRLYKFCLICAPLMGLSKGILLSIKSLSWTAFFVLIVVYGSSIFTTMSFNDIVDEEMDDFYGSLNRSMYTMFTVLTLEGWNEVSNRTAKHYPYCKLFFVIYVCFATLTVMNVVTGIILDTYLSVSERLSGDTQCEKEYGQQLVVARLLSQAKKSKEKLFHSNTDSSIVIIPEDKAVAYTKKGSVNAIDADATVARLSIHSTHLRGHADSSTSSPVVSKNVDGKRMPPKIQMFQDDVKYGDADSGHGDALVARNIKYDDVHLHPWGRFKSSDVSYISVDESQVSRDPSDDESLSQFGDIIDMTEREPIDILKDPVMRRVFDVAEIPEYQVYEVLNMYYMHGLRRLTAAELYRSCTRAAGKASGRHLLSFELGVTKRLDDMEKHLQRLKTDLVRAIDRMETLHYGAGCGVSSRQF